NIASASLPSTVRPGKPYAAARSTGSTANCACKGVRVLVVLEDEDDRQLLDAGPVHRLVEVAARRRPVPEPGDRAATLAAQPEGHRHRGGHEHPVGQHRAHPTL